MRWNFRVLLDDAPIGYHRYTLSERGALRELKAESRLEVKVLFVTAYSYTHDVTEQWRGNCLESLRARTDDNGTQSTVEAVVAAGALVVTTAKGREPLSGCSMSFAYWNPQMLRQSRLLNPQTGAYETVRVVAHGEERIAVQGAPVMAQRFRVSGAKFPIDLWYSTTGEWLALESTVGGGRRLRYELN